MTRRGQQEISKSQIRKKLALFLHLEDEKLPSLIANDQLMIAIATYVPKTNAILCHSTLNLSRYYKCGTLTANCYLKG